MDEVSIDLTLPSSTGRRTTEGKPADWLGALNIAREIKQSIKVEMGEWVTASIGIAESRLLAKIGTDLQKPNGLVLILSQDQAGSPVVNAKRSTTGTNGLEGVKTFTISELYDILDLEDVPGIGPRLKRSLAHHGITTLRQLSSVPVGVLHSWYGVSGVWLYDLSHFRDAWRSVNLDERQIHSIGHQYSLGKRNAFYKKEKVVGLFWKLAEKVAARCRKRGMAGSSVSVYFGYATGGGVGGSRRTQDFFDDAPTIVKVAERWLADLNVRRGVTFLAVTISDLQPKVEQGVLFPDFKLKKELPKTIDKINERFGDFTVMYAPTIAASDRAGDTVGFGRTRERLDWAEE